MTDEESDNPIDFSGLLDGLRKSTSMKAGAIMFGEAHAAYYETMKQHMDEEAAFNMTAHTTECIIKGIATAAGPVVEALLKASFLWDHMRLSAPTEKEVPGGN